MEELGAPFRKAASLAACRRDDADRAASTRFWALRTGIAGLQTDEICPSKKDLHHDAADEVQRRQWRGQGHGGSGGGQGDGCYGSKRGCPEEAWRLHDSVNDQSGSVVTGWTRALLSSGRAPDVRRGQLTIGGTPMLRKNERSMRDLNRSGIGGGSMRWPQPPVGAGVERSNWSRARGAGCLRSLCGDAGC
jgi:hypothetical protein